MYATQVLKVQAITIWNWMGAWVLYNRTQIWPMSSNLLKASLILCVTCKSSFLATIDCHSQQTSYWCDYDIGTSFSQTPLGNYTQVFVLFLNLELLALLDYVSRAHEIEICPSTCGIDYLWSYCMDFFPILVVASPGPYAWKKNFFEFFYEYCRFR